MPQDIEHHVDATTTIRVTFIDKIGPPIWVASEYRNGHRIGTIGDGFTSEDAINSALNCLRRRDEMDQAAQQLADAGIYADLTQPAPGIHRQLADAIRSPARADECHYCGLDPDTCDCR